MVFVEAPWTDQTPGSVSRLNRMMVIIGPGADLATVDKTQHCLLKCTETGSGFTIDHVYETSTDGTTTIDISSIASHTHSSTAEGGSVLDIMRSNPLYYDLGLTRTTDLKKASWLETAGGSGTAEDTIDGTSGERSIRLRTNTISGDAYTIQYPHLQIDFSKRSFFQFKARIETLSSLALHSGVNCDSVTAVDSNTVKYDAEICTTTNNNWHLRSASGSNKSMSDTGTAATTSRVGIRIEHFPDLGTPEVDMYIDAAAVFQKTSDVPITGTSDDNNLIKHSIKNSTTADRPYHVYGSRLAYFISDNWV